MRKEHLLPVALLFVLTAFQSCVKEIDTSNLPVENKLMVFCMLTPDSLVSVRVSKTSSLLKNESDSTAGVKVELFQNGIFLEWLTFKGDGWFTSTKTHPVVSNTYTIKATAPGFADAEGTDSIPVKTIIKRSVKTLWVINNPDMPQEFINYKNYFSDPAEPGNYYELLFFDQTKLPIVESSEFRYYINFFAGNLVDADPCISNEDYLNSEFSTFVFSDHYIDQNDNSVDIKFISGDQWSNFFSSALGSPLDGVYQDIDYTALRSVSKAYYLFRKSYYKYISGQELFRKWDASDPFSVLFTANPSDVFTNVKNGYGIVAAYQHSYVKTELQK